MTIYNEVIINNEYIIGNELDHGSYGTVHLGKTISTGETVVIKKEQGSRHVQKETIVYNDLKGLSKLLIIIT